MSVLKTQSLKNENMFNNGELFTKRGKCQRLDNGKASELTRINSLVACEWTFRANNNDFKKVWQIKWK